MPSMLLIFDQKCMQRICQFVNQSVTAEEIISIFTVERLQTFVGVTRFKRWFCRLIGRGDRDRWFVGNQPGLLKLCYDLIEHMMGVVLPSVNRGKELAVVGGNARRPPLTIYPYRTDLTL